jgi:hypothetical protein
MVEQPARTTALAGKGGVPTWDTLQSEEFLLMRIPLLATRIAAAIARQAHQSAPIVKLALCAT